MKFQQELFAFQTNFKLVIEASYFVPFKKSALYDPLSVSLLNKTILIKEIWHSAKDLNFTINALAVI